MTTTPFLFRSLGMSELSTAQTPTFKVGDWVKQNNSTWPAAQVVELTARGGFKWRLDQPYSLGPRHGTVQEGEAYGFAGWRKALPEELPQPSLNWGGG